MASAAATSAAAAAASTMRDSEVSEQCAHSIAKRNKRLSTVPARAEDAERHRPAFQLFERKTACIGFFGDLVKFDVLKSLTKG